MLALPLTGVGAVVGTPDAPCPPGTVGDASGGLAGQCTPCEPGFYCAGDQANVNCARGVWPWGDVSNHQHAVRAVVGQAGDAGLRARPLIRPPPPPALPLPPSLPEQTSISSCTARPPQTPAWTARRWGRPMARTQGLPRAPMGSRPSTAVGRWALGPAMCGMARPTPASPAARAPLSWPSRATRARTGEWAASGRCWLLLGARAACLPAATSPPANQPASQPASPNSLLKCPRPPNAAPLGGAPAASLPTTAAPTTTPQRAARAGKACSPPRTAPPTARRAPWA